MWIDNKTYAEDLEKVASLTYIPWSELNHKVVMVTGGTGLLGASVINQLLYLSQYKSVDVKVVAIVRDIARAKAMFGAMCGAIVFVQGDIETITVDDIKASGLEQIDYIVHGASPTKSAFFSQKPVETIQSIVGGTRNLLEIAKTFSCQQFVYLSSMEVYGKGEMGVLLSTDAKVSLDTMNTRECYPEGKRLAEVLCAAYSSECNVPVSVVRLAQTFGCGVPATDNRVFVQFAKAVIGGQDIILETKGESAHLYLYTADAVAAILTVMLKGGNREVYNIGNPDTYCSIYEMAQLVASEVTEQNVKVYVKEYDGAANKYPSTHHINLDISKIRDLGWSPMYGLADMYKRMIKGME